MTYSNCNLNDYYIRSIDSYKIPPVLYVSNSSYANILIEKGCDALKPVIKPDGTTISAIKFLLYDKNLNYDKKEALKRARLLYNNGANISNNEFYYIFPNAKRSRYQSPINTSKYKSTQYHNVPPLFLPVSLSPKSVRKFTCFRSGR